MLARLVLQQTALPLARRFTLGQLVAPLGQASLDIVQRAQPLLAFIDERGQLLTAREDAARGIFGAANPQEVAPDPVAITTNQTFTFGKRGTPGQRLLERFDRADSTQPGREIDTRLDLVEQAAPLLRRRSARCDAQLAFGERGEIERAQIIQHHGLQIRAKHRLDGDLPTGLDT